MSGKNWLERDPKDSPGLQRIREAQQAAAIAKAQEAQWAREAAIAAQEAERKRLEMIARIEQKTAQVLPLLEEIRDFANRTGTYPLGLIKRETPTGLNEVVCIAKIKSHDGLKHLPEKFLEVSYGYKTVHYNISRQTDFDVGGDLGSSEVMAECFGIRLRVDNNGKTWLYKQNFKYIPAHDGVRGTSWPATTQVIENWVGVPDEETEIKTFLAQAFHNPVYLGTKKPPFREKVAPQPEPQANTGIASLVKGFLGLK